jgi:hypothetical protein
MDTFLVQSEFTNRGGFGFGDVIRFQLPNCTTENVYMLMSGPFYAEAKPVSDKDLKPDCFPPANLIGGYDCFVIFSGPGRRELRIRYNLKSAPQGGPRTGLFFRGIKI